MSITTSAQQIIGNQRIDIPASIPEEYWELIAQYREDLIGQAAQILGNRVDAEDVVQETFVDAFRDCKKLPAAGSIGAWLRQINRCNALNHRRGSSRLIKLAGQKQQELPEQTFTTGGFSVVDLRESMRKALGDLPEQLRAVVELRYWEQLSFSEIAQRLQIPMGTVQSRLFDASNRLYVKLKTNFEKDFSPQRREDAKNGQ
jgi:RNA polymerase sigma-70 factor (ECF subfamily)